MRVQFTVCATDQQGLEERAAEILERFAGKVFAREHFQIEAEAVAIERFGTLEPDIIAWRGEVTAEL